MKNKMFHSMARAWLVVIIGLCLLALTPPALLANEFADYQDGPQNYEYYVTLPEITGGWFAAIDYFPDNGNGDTIGNYETRGRALVANHRYIYMQKNYGSGAGDGSWSVGSTQHGITPDSSLADPPNSLPVTMPGGHDNWIIVAEVTPGVGDGTGGTSMDPSFIHISPDGTKVALGLGYQQPMLVFPISLLDPDNPPLLNSGVGGNTAGAGVTLFPWGTAPADGVQYYEAEWVPDPDHGPVYQGAYLDPSAPTNNVFLAINTDRSWASGGGGGSTIEILDTSSSSNRPVQTIVKIGYAPYYSASADLTIDRYGNLITGQGYDYNDPSNGETGQLKIFGVWDWMDAYLYAVEDPADAIEYDHNTNIIADKVLSAAALGVDQFNNLHVGGGDVVGPSAGEYGFAAVIHAEALEDALDDLGPIDETDPSIYKQLVPDPIYGSTGHTDDSATFAVYNPWAKGIVLIWNPVNYSTWSPIGGSSSFDGWFTTVQPVATQLLHQQFAQQRCRRHPGRQRQRLPDGQPEPGGQRRRRLGRRGQRAAGSLGCGCRQERQCRHLGLLWCLRCLGKQ